MLLLELKGGKKSWKLRSLWLILSSLPRSPIHQDLSPSIDEGRSQKPCDENPPYNPTIIHLHKLNRRKKYSSLSIFICRTTTLANFKDNKDFLSEMGHPVYMWYWLKCKMSALIGDWGPFPILSESVCSSFPSLFAYKCESDSYRRTDYFTKCEIKYWSLKL